MERKFVLEGQFYKLRYEWETSVYGSHFNTAWGIGATTSALRLESRISRSSNLWSVDVEYTFFLVKGDNGTEERKKLNSEPLRDVFNSLQMYGQKFSCPEIKDYVVNGNLTVVCEVKIIKTRGIRTNAKHNFNEPIEGKTDVVLVVGDRKFHASKLILANASPVFNAMFFGNFQESKMTEIEIKDVKPEYFENLLSFIYHAYDDVNFTDVSGLQDIADRFDVESLLVFCEKYLINTLDVDIVTKLKLSEEFKFADLQEYCLETFQNKSSMWEIMGNADEMGELTVRALLRKARSFF